MAREQPSELPAQELFFLLGIPTFRIPLRRHLQTPAQSLGRRFGDRLAAAEDGPELSLEQLRLENLEVEHDLVPGRDDDALLAVAGGRHSPAGQSGGGVDGEEAETALLPEFKRRF